MWTEVDILEGSFTNGALIDALHVYLPPSDERTGLKVRERVETVPRVTTALTVLFPSLPSITSPPGPTHSTVGGSFMLGMTVTVHSKVYSVSWRAFSPVELVISTLTQSSGTAMVIFAWVYDGFKIIF